MVVSVDEEVVWHDLECGRYRADLPLWRELASGAGAGAGGSSSTRVLDLGAGTGRVTLDLAAAGYPVTALDRDAKLLEALAERAGELPVETVCADACDFSLARTDYDLCVVPMQTIQLLASRDERLRLFARAAAHMRPGALLAVAIVTEVDTFDSTAGGLGPSPERVELERTLYMSRAIRLTPSERTIRIERERLVLPAGGGSSTSSPELNVVELAVVDETGLWEEMRTVGLSPEPSRRISETEEHSGSEVVIARA